jgi:glycosyltransferase involved in cell wall biosynthesis
MTFSIMQSIRNALLGPRLSFIHEFKRPPYGGGNQFLLALKNELAGRGVDVGERRIGPRTRHVLFNSFNFDMDWLRAQLSDKSSRGIHTVHRVDGPISAYRGKDIEVDRKILEINRDLADATVFQSQYSMDEHRRIGLDFGDNAHVIMNAVNAAIFHPNGRIPFPHNGSRKIRLVTTSWSPNRRKGADVYEWLDAELDFSTFDFIFIGNTPSTFRNIKVVPPVPSEQLADMLRQQDVYITASQNDPCSNALTEALACGMPALYRNSGGHPEIVKQAGLGFDDAPEVPALLDRIVENHRQFQTAIDVPTIGAIADRYLKLFNIASPS